MNVLLSIRSGTKASLDKSKKFLSKLFHNNGIETKEKKMKSKEHEISSVSHISFSSKKVMASVVAGLLLCQPVLLSTANVAYATVDTVAAGGEIDRANVTDYDVIHLKDKTLEKAIIDKYNNGWQTNSYPYTISEITHQVIPRIQMLYFLADSRPKYLYIRYLDGLEKFTELTTIDFPDNNISDITPLKNLNKLEDIDLSNNNISDITPLKNLNKLKKVDLSNNRITDARGIRGSHINVFGQTVTLHPKSTTVDLKKEIIGLGGDDMVFNSSLDDNIVNGVLTYKDGMPDQYYVYAHQKHRGLSSSLDDAYYSARITVDFSQAKKESEKTSSETQAEDISEGLETLLGEYDTVKGTDNYKNADDKLKQAYDEAITEGKTIYDKLSSTPEQVKQATEQIKAALDRLNGDSKSETIIKGLQSQLDTAQQKLKKAEEQGTADKAKIKELKGQISTLNNQLEQLKKDKIKSEQEKQKEIDKLNGKIADLGKQIEKLTQENTSLKDQIAALQATISRLTEDANQCHVSDGAHAQELEKVKQQLTQAQSDLEKLKTDKTQSDQEKQKEIDRLSNQVTQLNQEITKLKQQPQVPPAPAPQVPVPQIPAPKPAPEPPAPRVPDKKELPQTPKQPSVKDSRDQIHLPKTNDILVGTLGVVVVACAGVALIAYGVYKRRQQH